MDNCYIIAASQFYMTGLGHLVIVSNGQLLHECSNSTVYGWSGHLVTVSNGQLLNKCSVSTVHCWSWSSCNDK